MVLALAPTGLYELAALSSGGKVPTISRSIWNLQKFNPILHGVFIFLWGVLSLHFILHWPAGRPHKKVKGVIT